MKRRYKYLTLCLLFILLVSVVNISYAGPEIKYMTVSFGKRYTNSASKTINIPNLKSVVSVTPTSVSNASVNHNINGENVTINISGGTKSGREADTKTRIKTITRAYYSSSYPTSQSWAEDGYSGTLNKVNSSTKSVDSSVTWQSNNYNRSLSITKKIEEGSYDPGKGRATQTFRDVSYSYGGTIKSSAKSLLSSVKGSNVTYNGVNVGEKIKSSTRQDGYFLVGTTIYRATIDYTETTIKGTRYYETINNSGDTFSVIGTNKTSTVSSKSVSELPSSISYSGYTLKPRSNRHEVKYSGTLSKTIYKNYWNYSVKVGYIDNQTPSLILNTPNDNSKASGIDGYKTLTVSGSVSDADTNDTVFVRYKKQGSGTTHTILTTTSNSGEEHIFSEEIDFSFLPDGTHIIEFYAEDDKGGKDVVTKTIHIDKSPPIVNAPTINAISEYELEVLANASDTNGLAVTPYLYNKNSVDLTTWVSDEQYVDVGLEPNTMYNYKYKALDKLGNKSDYSPVGNGYTLALDPTDVVLNSKTSTSITVDIIGSTENGEPPEYKIEMKPRGSLKTDANQSLADWGTSTTRTLTGLVENTEYDIWLTTRNGDDIENTKYKALEVKTNVAPVITDKTDDNQMISEVPEYKKVTIKGDILDEDIGDTLTLSYLIDGGTEKELEIVLVDGSSYDFEHNIDLSYLSEGTHIIEVWVRDGKGGESSISKTIHVNKTPVDITISNPPTLDYSNVDLSTDIELSDDLGIKEILVKYDGNIIKNETYANIEQVKSIKDVPMTTEVDFEGIKSLEITAMDIVGNKITKTYEYLFDKVPSEVTGNYDYSGNKYILDIMDTTSGLANLRYYYSEEDQIIDFETGFVDALVKEEVLLTGKNKTYTTLENSEGKLYLHYEVVDISTNACQGVLNVNQPPTLTVANEDFLVSGRDNLTLRGTVNDVDGDNVTIKANISGIEKNTMVENGTGDWFLSWSGKNLAEGIYSNINIIGADKVYDRSAIFKGNVIVDKTGAVLVLNGLSEMKINMDEEYVEQGATAVDDISGDVSENIKIEGDVDTSIEGLNTITYRVNDEAGNKTVKTRKVQVVNQYKDILKNITIDDGDKEESKTIMLPSVGENIYYSLVITDLEDNTKILDITSGGEQIDFVGKQGHSYNLVFKIFYNGNLRATREVNFTIADVISPYFTGVYVLDGNLTSLGSDNYKLHTTPYGFSINRKGEKTLVAQDGSYKTDISMKFSGKDSTGYTSNNTTEVQLGDRITVYLRDHWNNITTQTFVITSLNEVLLGDVPESIEEQIEENNYIPVIDLPVESDETEEIENVEEIADEENILEEGNTTVDLDDGQIDENGNILVDDESGEANITIVNNETGDKYNINIVESNEGDGKIRSNVNLGEVPYVVEKGTEIDINDLLKEGYTLKKDNKTVIDKQGNIITDRSGLLEFKVIGPTGIEKNISVKIEDSNATEKIEYIDINEHWAKKEILNMTKQGYLQGYPDRTYRPDENVTRAEFLTTLDKIKVKNSSKTREVDINEIIPVIYISKINKDTWYYHNVSDILRDFSTFEVIYGFEEKINFEKDITRDEVAYIITHDMKLQKNNQVFKDIRNNKFREEINTSYINKLMNGYTDGSFKPKKNLTRAELAVLIERIDRVLTKKH